MCGLATSAALTLCRDVCLGSDCHCRNRASGLCFAEQVCFTTLCRLRRSFLYRRLYMGTCLLSSQKNREALAKLESVCPQALGGHNCGFWEPRRHSPWVEIVLALQCAWFSVRQYWLLVCCYSVTIVNEWDVQMCSRQGLG